LDEPFQHRFLGFFRLQEQRVLVVSPEHQQNPGPRANTADPDHLPGHVDLRALEQSGAISGYHAHLDANALGLTFEALVFVTMRAGDRDTVDAFEQAVAAIPDVLQAQRLFGDPDYLLRIITRDLPAYQQLYDNRLATLPGVQRLSSTLVMKSVVENRPLPL
jgi:DNA-binding Lrp family transcriptional regulator